MHWSANNRKIAGTGRSSVDGWCWNDTVRQRIPDHSGGNREGSATDSRQFEREHTQDGSHDNDDDDGNGVFRQLTVAFDLPYRVAHSPQRRDGEQDGRQVPVGNPDEQKDGKAELKHRGHPDEGFGGNSARQNTHDDREEKVGNAKRNHVVANVLDSQSARHVRLYISKAKQAKQSCNKTGEGRGLYTHQI